MSILFQEIRLRNILSFGPDSPPVPLGPLNIMIGPNGSGKSNFIDAIGLFRAATRDLSAPVKGTGGVLDWLWKGSENPTATVEAIVENPRASYNPLRHRFSFREHGRRFEITAERIEYRDPFPGHSTPYDFYSMEGGNPRLREKAVLADNPTQPEEESASSEERFLTRDQVSPEESILSQVKDPQRYPSLHYLSNMYERMRLYREWSFGRNTPQRNPQKTDLPTDYLSESGENLALVLNNLRSRVKRKLLEALSHLYPAIGDFQLDFTGGGWVQLLIEEDNIKIPASRLSDGTLRYLCLLAILCHPEPPPLVCIEEPELGLHPDVLPGLAKLMIEASDRCQLIVTTHSDALVDCFTDSPDSVLVCEKIEGSTTLKRLEKSHLEEWLKKYSLGELWRLGQLGGNRW